MISMALTSAPDGNTALAVIGSVVAAFLALCAAVYGARQAARANARTASVAERAADTTGALGLVKALQDELKRVTERVDGLERDRDAEREARRVAERSRVAAEEEAATERRLRAEERRGRQEAVGAYRDLREVVRHALPDLPIPPAPASVEALL